jgi:phage-related minor tail protein
MTSGGGAGGAVDVAYVDVTVRSNGEQSMRELESTIADGTDRAGKQGGNALTRGLQGGLAALPALGLAAGAAIAGAVVAGAGAAISIAQQVNRGVVDIQASLGVTVAEATALGETAKAVFGNNWTGSLAEAQQAVTNVRREIQGLAKEDIQTVTEGTVAISEKFEEEQSRVAAAVDAVMKSTGLGAQEALDFITSGFQKGLNSSGDFLDTLTEYAPQFEKAKIGGDELFSLLETGAAKGALGTDKIADAFKEFGLTLVDVSDKSSAVYKELGLNQQKIVDDVNSGAISQAQAFQMVTDKLKDVKGVADKTRIGAAIFGGAGEDFANGLTNIDLTKTKLSDLKGSTDQVKNATNTMQAVFQTAGRQLLLSLEPVGQELLKVANQALPYVTAAVAKLGPTVMQVVTGLIDGFRKIGPAIDAVSAGAAKLSGFLERNKEILIPLGVAVGAVAAGFGIYQLAIITASAASAAYAAVIATATTVSAALGTAITFMTGPIGIAITAIAALIAVGVYLYRNWDEVKAKALAIWSQVKETISTAIQGAVNFLKNIDLKEVAVRMLVGYVNGIRGAVGLVLKAGEAIGTAILNALRALPGKMVEIAGQIVAGLANGIAAGAGRIGQAASKLAGSAFDAIKKKLNIQSPSKEMFILGEHTANGFANGIEKTVPAVQKAAAKVADTAASELAKARAALEKGINMEKWVDGLQSATRAQLEHAQALARSAGDAEKYNAIKGELARRQDLATAATKKATDAAQQQREELSNNRAQIAAGEAQERYVIGLRSSTDAQLASALQTARNRGEVEKYNTIKAEQARREGVSEAAQKKSTDAIKAAADAAKAAADQITANRKAITDGLAFGVYVEGLRDYTDAGLAAARANALAAGDSQKFNSVLAEQKARAGEAAQAVSDLADAQIKAANGRFADTEGATDSAYRQTYGAGDEGLIKSLAATTGLSVAAIRADVNAALDDAKRFAPAAAAIIERTWAEALAHRKTVGAAQAQEAKNVAEQEAQSAQEGRDAYIDAYEQIAAFRRRQIAEQAAADATELARAVAMAGERRDQIVETYQAEQASADDASITVESLTGQIRELVALGRNPGDTMLDYLKALATGSGQAAVAAQEVIDKFNILVLEAQPTIVMEDTPVEARGVRTTGVKDEGVAARTPNRPLAKVLG